ncbi:hypothetical protein T440DRAFT_41415 [Plenodomus tracheiphilus IPT5]|uniref:Uncharacterized protein n=1 Tax=Plenodomus tracheiphilus IPT5 TaxID=1408161 RepID=A0A6A7BAA9_9PLEO|nr:hypothetical protein T440DRAFT_41415 [Plenodomus tracheiphilus IPT5]
MWAILRSTFSAPRTSAFQITSCAACTCRITLSHTPSQPHKTQPQNKIPNTSQTCRFQGFTHSKKPCYLCTAALDTECSIVHRSAKQSMFKRGLQDAVNGQKMQRSYCFYSIHAHAVQCY